MKRKLTWMAIGLAVWLAGLPGAQGAVMRPLSIAELTRRADLIVQGTVQGKTCLHDDAGRIYTKITVQVSGIWKGKLPPGATTNALTIVQGGGTVGDVRQDVSGAAQYKIGEEFAAFLVINSRREPVTLGLAQGKFHIWRNKRTGVEFAVNLFHGTPKPGLGPGGRRPLPLNTLKQQVQAAAPSR